MARSWVMVIVRMAILLSVCALLGVVVASMMGRVLPRTGEIAFMARESETWDIYVMDVARGVIERVTFGQGNNRFPAWSPDGAQIAFHSDRDNNGDRRQYELYVMRTDGRHQQRLTDENLRPFEPFLLGEPMFALGSAMAAWSPDGRKIAFHADIAGNWDLYTLDLHSRKVEALTNSEDDEVLLAWSPDGQRAAYTNGPDGQTYIFVMDANGANQQQLTGLDALIVTPSETVLEIVPPLMATATALVPPSSVPSGNPNTNFIQHWHPDWSADGQRIVFASQEGSFVEELYVIDVATGQIERLTDNGYAEQNPVWLPDGRLMFTSDREVIRSIWVMNADGREATRLTPRNLEADAAVWRP